VRDRHQKIHTKKFITHAKNMGNNKSYGEKLKFIEQKIESDIQYFNMKNILDENAI